MKYTSQTGGLTTAQILDLDLRVDVNRSDAGQVIFSISAGDLSYSASFSLETDRLIHASENNAQEIIVEPENIPLDEFLNHFPPVFYTSELGSFQQFSYFPPSEADAAAFDLAQVETVDWRSIGTDIENEFGQTTRRGRSIHEYLRERLVQSPAELVFYDHGPGKIADFVTFSLGSATMSISLYHCKGSSDPVAGARVGDAYEVCGQAVKSDRWADRRRVYEAIRRRLNRENGASRFEKGDLEALRQMLDRARRTRVVFEAVIVQPGFSRAGIGGRIASLLGAADSFLFSGGRFERLRVIGSE